MNLDYRALPLVSIIITTYKGQNKLKRAITSSLNQTYKNIEIIVVDDNDQDSIERKETEVVMQEFADNSKVRYIKHIKNKNGAAARNTGIEKSNGEYISFLDNDDLYLPNKVEKCVLCLYENSDYYGVYTSVLLRLEGKSRSIIHANKRGNLQKDLLLDYMLIGTGSNLFISKSALKILKGFDENFLRHQDIEFLVRFFNNFKMINIDEVLVIKDNYKNENKVNYAKMRDVKKLFFSKFHMEIENLEDMDKERYYKNQYFELLTIACDSNKNQFIKEAKKSYFLYRDFSKKDIIIKILINTNLYRGKFYNTLRIVKDKIKAYLPKCNDFDKEIYKYDWNKDNTL